LNEGREKARSAELLTAQQRLHALRQQVQGEQDRLRQRAAAAEVPGPSPTPLVNGPEYPLPKHLGWGSQPPALPALTEALRRAQGRQPYRRAPGPSKNSGPAHSPVPLSSSSGSSSPAALPEVRLYPDLALAILRRRLAAAGRIWLLLRHMDAVGRGWVTIEQARLQLTEQGSSLRVCGWRQLRKLLAQGEGLFWERSNQRIWLRALPRVAAALEVQRLGRRPVALPLPLLLGGIGTLRAHFYAAFHSGRPAAGRARSSLRDRARSQPIARATLQDLCRVSRRTLRNYERRAGVRRQFNYAIGPQHSPSNMQEQSWRRGRAVFVHRDHLGKVGRPGGRYVAWQLPNSYVGPHVQQTTSQPRRFNRKLADLPKKGTAGNGERPVERRPSHGERYMPTGSVAAGRRSRRSDAGFYWPGIGRKDAFLLWFYLPVRVRHR
jgi:hypothetical protein